jgi:integrase
MRGSIRQKSKDSWQIQVYTGKDPEGKYRRHLETVRGRKGDAQRRLTELLTSLDKGVYTPPGKLTVADLLRTWLKSKTTRAPKTLESYQSIVEKHLIPALGTIKLSKLQPPMVQAYYDKTAGGLLSARSVHYHHRLLKQALKYAVRQGYLSTNVCERVDPPSPEHKEMRPLEETERESLVAEARGIRLYPAIYTALCTGLRRAELLGLTWRDIDLESDHPTVSVNRVLYKSKGVIQYRPPKTKRSRRRVKIVDKLVAYLRDYKADQESLNLHLGRLLSLDDLVFCHADGQPFDPSVLSHSFSRVAKRAGLGNVRFHDLRHTVGTIVSREAGPEAAAEMLGHEDAGFTLKWYGDRIFNAEAVAKLNAKLPKS